MFIVYILRSEKNPKKTYVGSTTDLQERVREHNEGKSIYTKQFRPWRCETYIVFSDGKLAEQFEKYLKSGSGYAFLKKRLIQK